MSKPIVIALGEILWDMLPTGKRAGGAPVNFAYHASQNGAESYAISAVGTKAQCIPVITINGINPAKTAIASHGANP